MPPSRPSTDRFCALFRQHAGFVEAVLRRHGVPEADLEDLVQEVFLVVYRKVEAFEGRAAFRTWLYRIAFQVASAHRRLARHRREQPGAAEPLDRHSSEDPLRDADRRRFARDLEQALEALDEDRRTIFVLHELEERPMREVSTLVGCPLKTGFSRLYSARRIIGEHMASRGWAASALPMLLPSLLPSFVAAGVGPRSPVTPERAATRAVRAWQAASTKMSAVAVPALLGLALLLAPAESGPAPSPMPEQVADLALPSVPLAVRFEVAPEEPAPPPPEEPGPPRRLAETPVPAVGHSDDLSSQPPTVRRVDAAAPESREAGSPREAEAEADFVMFRTTASDVRRPSPYASPSEPRPRTREFDRLATLTAVEID